MAMSMGAVLTRVWPGANALALVKDILSHFTTGPYLSSAVGASCYM